MKKQNQMMKVLLKIIKKIKVIKLKVIQIKKKMKMMI